MLPAELAAGAFSLEEVLQALETQQRDRCVIGILRLFYEV
jgi:hypothetical protein